MAQPYFHIVRYYETDKMGITHHSNYLRFMEEARLDFLEQIGYGYQKMESEGLSSPVVAVHIDYKRPTTFNDKICIEVHLQDVTTARLVIGYTMLLDQETVCTAISTHCFVDGNGRPVSLKRTNAQLYELLLSLTENQK